MLCWPMTLVAAVAIRLQETFTFAFIKRAGSESADQDLQFAIIGNFCKNTLPIKKVTDIRSVGEKRLTSH